MKTKINKKGVSRFVVFILTFSLVFSVFSPIKTIFADENQNDNIDGSPLVDPTLATCQFEIVSDDKTKVDGANSVATYSENPRWTVSIPGATWIWKSFLVEKPVEGETFDFEREFYLSTTSSIASIIIAADNNYIAKINGHQFAEYTQGDAYFEENKKSYDINSYLVEGKNILNFTVENLPFSSSTPYENPAGILYKLAITMPSGHCNNTPPPPPPQVTNTPPSITLIGDNPLNIFVGSTFTDPGATATDTEDGDLTSQIVRTGDVNTAEPGTYTLFYSVVDSKGSSVSVTRTINVTTDENCDPITHTCLLPDSLGDTALKTFGGDGEKTLQEIITDAGYSNNVLTSQKQYQKWNLPNASTTIEVEMIDGITIMNNIFGYYLNSDISTFIALPLTNGQKTSFTVRSANSISFGIRIGSNSEQSNLYSTEISKNVDGASHVVTFETRLPSGKLPNDFILGFEDAPSSIWDHDYQDLVVRIKGISCGSLATNTPPSITLIGDNPLNIFVGSTFTDPGATATDTEDGDLTSQIVRTGSVGTSTGTYILTYVIKDSGNLYATATRAIIIKDNAVPPSDPDNKEEEKGGGSGGIGGHRRSIVTSSGTTNNTCSYLRDYLNKNWQNDSLEVIKLQSFLNAFEKENLSVNGIFDEETFAAVKRFQAKYSNDILSPWGYNEPTGFVYILTKNKINEIYCNTIYNLSTEEQQEIEQFKSLNSGKNAPYPDLSESVGMTGGIKENKKDISEQKREEKATTSAESILLGTFSKIKDSLAAVSLFSFPEKVCFSGNLLSLLAAIFMAIIIAMVILYKILHKKPATSGKIIADSSNVIPMPAPKKEENEKLKSQEENTLT